MAGVWKKALIYLGLVEEEDELEPIPPEAHEPPPLETVRPIRPDSETGVRRIGHDPVVAEAPSTVVPHVRVHVVEPKTFNDAKDIGDRLRVDSPVIVNLQQTERETARRIIDFASGLTYMSNGGIQEIATKVFLLTPPNVEVSAEETQRIISERGFFNQY